MNIYDLISRAQKLRKETQLDSVSPDRVGGLHEDTLKYINEFQLLASSPSLHKIYASVSAMQSDKSPKSDLTGKPLKPGQLVVIVPANQTDATAGDVYRYDGPSGNTSAWTFVAKIGAVPADAELSATSTNPPQNKVVTEKLTELEQRDANSIERLIGWNNLPNNKGAIAYLQLSLELGTYKAYKVKEGDKIRIQASTGGAYLAFVTKLPTSEKIPYVNGESRNIVNANSTKEFTTPNGANWVMIESGRDGDNTTPIGVWINGYDMFRVYVDELIQVITSTSKIGVFYPYYTSYVNIEKERITIPSNSRVIYNGKTYYTNSEDIILNRDISLTAEFVVFDIVNMEYKTLSFANFDVSNVNYIFCFYVRNGLSGCSLSPSLYTINGAINEYAKQKFGIIVTPNDTKIEIDDTTITIPVYTRLYYDGVIYRTFEKKVVERLATSDGTYSEELLVFDTTTSTFRCVPGGEYTNEKIANIVIVGGLKKGNNGTTFSPQISSTNYITELCVAHGKKIDITDTTIKIPSNSRVYYNHNSYYQINNDIVLEREAGAQQQFVMFDYISKEIYLANANEWSLRKISTYPLFWVNYTNDCSLSASLYTINGESLYSQGKGILDFNPNTEVEQKLIQQTKNKSANVLTLLHFSDLHSSSTNLERIVQFRDRYNTYIDDAIHTGDTVSGIITDPNPFESVKGAANILNVIGNHESWLSYDIPDYTATEKQSYDKIFAPSITNWDVIQPSNAAIEGKCYYYKDYSDANIRLVVLDSVHWHTRNGVSDNASVQKSWFEETLADANNKGLTIIAALHYPPVNGIDLIHKTGFSRYSENVTEVWGDGWYASDEIFQCVDNFIANGGKFATWIMGHTHYDMSGQVHGHNGQLAVIIQSCSRSGEVDYLIPGTKTQDAFNILSIDAENSLVKITRIGNSVDIDMQSKTTMCYNYNKKVLIYNT